MLSITFTHPEHKEHIASRLSVDGWQLEQKEEKLIAKHPAVKNQVQARQKLYDNGLLTSHSIQIEFLN